MLYQDRPLGKAGIWARTAARLAAALGARGRMDADADALSPYLKRDLGVYGESSVSPWDYVWRK